MKKVLLLLLLLTVNSILAQDFKFGKVSKAELEQKISLGNNEVNAEVLYKSQTVRYDFNKEKGFSQVNTFHERIKIYNKEGYDLATKKVRLYDKTNANSENLTQLKGYTYQLVNGKIEKTKLKKESIFEEKNNKYWATKKFTMPNLSEGCIVEFMYSIKSPYIEIDDIILQYDIPIKRLEVDIKIPEYFNFKKLVNPKAVFYPKIEESKRSRKETVTSIRGVSQTGSRYRTGPGGGYSSNASEFTFDENIIKINLDNVPALKKEAYVDNRDNYRAKLALEYEYYKGPSGQLEYYSTTWDKVTNTINKSENFGSQLEKKNYFEDDLNTVISGVEDPIQKINIVYEFVKNRVKWNNFIGYNTSKGVRKAYKEKTGNTAEINLMLVTMLRHAGLSANPVLTSTRDNGVPLFPSTKGFNYVIAAVEMPENIILLDATNKNGTLNILPEYAINWQGRIIREHGSSAWIYLNPRKKSKEVVMLNYNIEADLSISGKLRKQLTEYLAVKYRNKYAGADEEFIVLNFEKDKGDIEIENIDQKNISNVTKPISHTYDFKLNNAVEDIGGSLYLSPLLFLATEENPFIQTERLYPIDFIYPMSSKYIINIDIPEGYEVESLPESTKIRFNENDIEFSYVIRQTGNKIQITMLEELNKTYILADEYQEFKKIFALSFEKQNEKIVLKKKG